MSPPKNPKLTKIKEKEKGKNQQQHADFFLWLWQHHCKNGNVERWLQILNVCMI